MGTNLTTLVSGAINSAHTIIKKKIVMMRLEIMMKGRYRILSSSPSFFKTLERTSAVRTIAYASTSTQAIIIPTEKISTLKKERKQTAESMRSKKILTSILIGTIV